MSRHIFPKTIKLTILALIVNCQIAQAQSVLPLLEPQSAETDVRAQAQVTTPLKSGDLIRVTVVGFPDLSGEQTVATNGTVYLPMVGEVEVAGLPIERAVEQIRLSLLPYVRRPQVALTLTTPAPLRVSITGEVLNPGPRLIPLAELETGNFIKLSQILIAAGGITPSADLRQITIRRKSLHPSVLSESAADTLIEVNFWDAIQTGSLSADPAIYDGDEIIVPTANVDGAEQQILLSSTVAPSRVTINVAGEVRRPGPVEISPTADVNAAIAAAGGPTSDANTNSIVLARMREDGQLSQEEFGFGEATTNVRNGDLIYVRKSTSSNILDFLGDIASPIRVLLGIFD